MEEDEAAGRDRAPMLDEPRERGREAVGRSSERPRQICCPRLDPAAGPLPHSFAALGEVEVPDEATSLDRAQRDELGGYPHRLTLEEPRKRRLEQGHGRAVVTDHYRTRRLVRIVHANDELVARACGRELRRGGPVDGVHVVSRTVGTRPGDVVAHTAAPAAHRAEEGADDPMPRDQGERPVAGRHVSASRWKYGRVSPARTEHA